MDVNKKGVVNIKEFVQAKKIIDPLNSEYMSTSEFATFDLSGSGEITLEDLIHGYETIIGYRR
jgi:Ca2+-binding EF-hand superfamily protein